MISRRAIKTVLLLSALCMSVSPALAEDRSEYRFMWQEAFSRISVARTPEDFNTAARAYQTLADSGVRNGTLFYNLGTALLMAEQYDAALIPLSRAERYMGNTWEIERNMLIAIAGKDRDEDASLPWYRVPMFWHFGLATSVRLAVAVLAFAAFWLFLALRLFGLKRGLRSLTILSLIIFVLFASSTVASFYAEHRAASSTGARSQMEVSS